MRRKVVVRSPPPPPPATSNLSSSLRPSLSFSVLLQVCILAGCLRKSGKQEQEATLGWPCVRRYLVLLADCLSCSSDGHNERGAAEEEEVEGEQEESMAVLATQVITMGMKKLARSDDQDCWRAIAEAVDLLVEDVKQQVCPSLPSYLGPSPAFLTHPSPPPPSSLLV